MEQLSLEDYVAALTRYSPDISSKSLEILKREGINGRRAKRMNTADFHAMSIPYGDAKDIIDFNENYNPEPTSPKEPILPTNSNSKESRSSQHRPPMSDQSESSAEEDFSDTDFEEISSYFKNFSELSDYEKTEYLKQKRKYEAALNEGKFRTMPIFMTRRASSNKSINKSVVDINIPSVSAKQSFKQSTKLTPLKRKISADSPVRALAAAGSDSPKSTSDKSSDANFSLSTESGKSSEDEEQTPKRRCPPKPKSKKSKTKSVGESSQTKKPDKELSVKTKRKKKVQRQKGKVQLSEEEYAATLPTYAIDDILEEAGRTLKHVRDGLKENGVLFGPLRKLMIRTLVNHLYYTVVKDVLHVTVKMREGMACSIVSRYPEFKSCEDPTKRSWWRLFDPSKPSGSIQNVVKAILNHLSPEKRPRGGGSGRTTKDDSEEEKGEDEDQNLNGDTNDPNAEWMSLEVAYDCNKKRLMEGMKASRDVRKKWIRQSNPFIADVLTKYPHLMSFDGEVIQQDFEYLFPDNVGKFIENFPSFLRGLKDLEKENIIICNEIIGTDGDVVSACFTISKLLPRPNLQRFRKGRGKGNESLLPDIASLVHIIPANTNVKDEVNSKRAKAGCPVQPYLLGLVPDKSLTRLYIVVDSKFIDLGKVSLLKGLDMLFKVFHVFNAEYPLGWKTFWEFVEHGMYQIEPRKLTNSGSELIRKVKAMQNKSSK